jgi:hypothetical protein
MWRVLTIRVSVPEALSAQVVDLLHADDRLHDMGVAD